MPRPDFADPDPRSRRAAMEEATGAMNGYNRSVQGGLMRGMQFAQKALPYTRGGPVLDALYEGSGAGPAWRGGLDRLATAAGGDPEAELYLRTVLKGIGAGDEQLERFGQTERGRQGVEAMQEDYGGELGAAAAMTAGELAPTAIGMAFGSGEAGLIDKAGKMGGGMMRQAMSKGDDVARWVARKQQVRGILKRADDLERTFPAVKDPYRIPDAEMATRHKEFFDPSSDFGQMTDRVGGEAYRSYVMGGNTRSEAMQAARKSLSRPTLHMEDDYGTMAFGGEQMPNGMASMPGLQPAFNQSKTTVMRKMPNQEYMRRAAADMRMTSPYRELRASEAMDPAMRNAYPVNAEPTMNLTVPDLGRRKR